MPQAAATGAPTEGTGDVKEQAKDQARQAAGQARDKVRGQIDQRSTQAGEQVTRQAGDLRAVGEELRKQGKEGPAKAADRLAERSERLGAWLQESDADRILDDVEDFGRRNPWALVAGGVALGFAASRMLKASSSRRYEQRSTQASAATSEARFERPATPAVPPEVGP
jgi:hypothetical protein